MTEQLLLEDHSADPNLPAEQARVEQGEYEDHPIAKLFPVLGEKESRELADDIGQNGLRSPVPMRA